MSVEEVLLKLQEALTGAGLSFQANKLPFLAGRFGGREAQFGIGMNFKKNNKEIFYKIKIEKLLNLPFWLQDHCPLKIESGAESQGKNLSIEESQWLVEHIRLPGNPENYFSEQTVSLVQKHFTELSEIVGRIETGEISLERIVNDFQRTGVRDYFKTLMVALGFIAVVGIALTFFVMTKKITIGGGAGRQETVQEEAAKPKKPPPKHRVVPADDNIFLKAAVDKKEVPLNGVLTLTYDLYTRYETRFWGFYQEGDFTGFQVTNKNLGKNVVREIVDFQGRKFSKVFVGEISLTVLKTGKQLLTPAVAFVSVKRKDGEIVDMYLKTPSIEINVKEGKQTQGF